MKLNVELVTPEALVFSSDVQMVVVPGAEGDFGVLVGHSPMISSLRPGIVDVYESDSKINKRIFIQDGFAEINAESCTILARSAVDVTDNPQEAERLLKESE
jgi:F-type H+-transporting ATPase subunit epsilon